ncbi:imidazole glycerol phosphate synthase subunit HisH [candidate division KSB1 bacterium]|nr:imidazole glycerol phosphate synthase subunit HisH [candidate division KSB1 bacterium]RQW05596.1 MAG: imidazole glycerol phosphate synthase subunit HisH [candidate division KSB1 bacterium]
MIYIIDYQAGNLRSVQKALENCGAHVLVTSRPDDLKNADKVIFPGVGAFGKAKESLEKYGFVEPINEFIKSGKPFLGICLGMQLFFESSEENPGVSGLSLFKGVVRRFPRDIKVPHLGWNELLPIGDNPLWKGIPPGSYFYFAHSFFIEPLDRSIVVGETDYFGRIAVAIRHNNILGVQFHPEKSQRHGLRVLQNFVDL